MLSDILRRIVTDKLIYVKPVINSTLQVPIKFS